MMKGWPVNGMISLHFTLTKFPPFPKSFFSFHQSAPEEKLDAYLEPRTCDWQRRQRDPWRKTMTTYSDPRNMNNNKPFYAISSTSHLLSHNGTPRLLSHGGGQ
ncbi:hypothetical protein DEO72_LG5g2450 [Vigna unguiculata]|uniref:Uncharacterized protein n=1 Tax=Vigna unguiculata TaxID=3917 RepID=A0A4D6M0F5_VIGUN|nr:hypothetical protein DEO72_LG5g2450 [Vigna unguiculata]